MKKLFVNKEACIGCGMCVSIDPNHFDFDEDGLSNVISEENIDAEEVETAISSCPTNAISYVEEGEEHTCNCEHCTCEDCHCDEDGCHCEDCE